ncbi:MAG TPA: serine/threonine-protein kinase [Verrucomicrobiae bacterium]|nr:serine/threonine-protein kinase [Verrucomicrobiae bacterium]
MRNSAPSGQDGDSEETIFSRALRLSPGFERSAYLEQACAGRDELRQRVEGLLKATPDLGDFMESLPSGSLDASQEIADGSNLQFDTIEEAAGTRIGRYKLQQKLGEGGCGVVYLAQQEEPVRRSVALKLIKLGMDTKSVIARFEAERQALAMMDHPNIAKVLDAGATDSGRPYFVMELVRGVRITEFCDENRLSTRERLDLFIQVCHAVQHAHQKGIIHRDLKPSNILVTINNPGSPGSPKIIDFGIAKATQGRLTDQTLFTAFEQFLGTPAYMSPEQTLMTALDVDTRSDIYSLGVLLYELLTGSPPFNPKDLVAAGFEEMRRTIREQEPPRPSTRLSTLLASEQATAATYRHTDPPKLIHLVRGDLDWIVMKCLEKDRARRYETADGLALDIQRHLTNQAVVARPPSRIYVFQKTIRRHKVGFVAAAALITTLAGAVLVSSLQARRATRAERQTRQTAYVADMDLANRALIEGDLGTAKALLRRYWPAPQQIDLRNWEWRYLANLSEGDPHFSLVAHSSAVSSLCFLDTNTLLTTGTADWRTVLWNLKERRPSNIITNGGGAGGVAEVMAVAPRHNAMFYRAAWSGAAAVTLVDLQNGNERRLLRAKGPVRWLDISVDQKTLAVASTNHIDFWELDRTAWAQSFETEGSPATQGLFSPDGARLVVADEAGHITFWNVAEHRKLGVLTITNAPEALGVLRFSTDGRWLVNPGGKWPTQIWNAEDRTLVAELQDAVFVARAVFSTDGRWLATVGGDASVRLWETSSWQKTRTFHGHTDAITAVDVSPDGRFLATGARNGEVKLWPLDEPSTAPERVSFPASEYFQLAADGSGFGRVSQIQGTQGDRSWTAEVWTSSPLQRSFTVPLPGGRPSSGVVLSGGRGLVLGGFDGSLRFFGAIAGEGIVVTNAHKGQVYILDASLDGSTLATKAYLEGMPDSQVLIWRLPRMELITALPRARDVHGVKLSDDGKLLAFFTGPGDMGVWEVPSMTGPRMWRGVGALQRVTVCAFSPDGRRLAAATPADGGGFLWDLTTHRRTVLPRALTEYTSMSFSPDGSRLAAGSEGESKLFDTASGQTVLSFKFPGLKLAFARDGETLLAVHREGAFEFHAPSFKNLQFDWLKERPSEEPPAYLGPTFDYIRPDEP